MTFFVEPSWSQRWRPGESQGPKKMIPGREHDVDGDGPQTLEEALTCHQFPRGGPPGPVSQFADRMTGECQQVEDREHRRQVLFAMTEVVLEIVALGFQNIERFVLDRKSTRLNS